MYLLNALFLRYYPRLKLESNIRTKNIHIFHFIHINEAEIAIPLCLFKVSFIHFYMISSQKNAPLIIQLDNKLMLEGIFIHSDIHPILIESKAWYSTLPYC